MKKPQKRRSQADDQDKSDEAYLLIKELIILNDHIDMNQFASACFSIWVNRFHESDISYEDFREENIRAIDFARHWLEE
jgi:hypothetical protein